MNLLPRNGLDKSLWSSCFFILFFSGHPGGKARFAIKTAPGMFECFVEGLEIKFEHWSGIGITLPETNSSHLRMDGWNTSFLWEWRIFRGYVSFKEGILKKDAAKRRGSINIRETCSCIYDIPNPISFIRSIDSIQCIKNRQVLRSLGPLLMFNLIPHYDSISIV